MKLLQLILITTLFSLTAKTQIVEIPDENFAEWIALWYPGCIDGNMLDTQCNSIQNETTIYCSMSSISNLEGVQYFINLEEIYVSNNNISEIPILPPSVWLLDISFNPIGNQNSFPDQIIDLDISSTGTTVLSDLSESLIKLDVSYNDINILPELPEGLTRLFIDENPIDSLFLGQEIQALSAQNCGLQYISSPLPNCQTFIVNNNLLTEVPYLGEEVLSFEVQDNEIECFTFLPNSAFGSISGNPFTCLPFYPTEGLFFEGNSIVDLTEYPLCLENDPINNPNNCSSAVGFEGFIHIDTDNQCDYNEDPLSNVPIKIEMGGQEVAISNSLSNGKFLFQGDLGNYQIDLDHLNVPFINNCGSQEFSLDESTPYLTDINFAIECEYENDFGVQSVIPDGWVFPGQEHIAQIAAGEMSQFYNTSCTGPSGGELIVTLYGPGIITGTPIDSPPPTTFSDNIISFDVADFTDVDLFDSFKINILTLETATSVDDLCFDVELIAEEEDPILENNNLTFCYPVVNSYDPNNKLVSPMNVEPGYNDWLYYTINFQNTGSAPAFNIRLEDELPENLDLETFQMTNTSHNSYFELVENDLEIFYPDIMLADSTTNEPESKGYFQFRIKTLNPIELGEPIENSAAIFFDFNDPIITNTAVTEAVLIDHISDVHAAEINIYPNPSSGEVSLSSSEHIIGIECMTILGKALQCESKLDGTSASLVFDESKGIVVVLIKTSNGVKRARIVLE